MLTLLSVSAQITILITKYVSVSALNDGSLSVLISVPRVESSLTSLVTAREIFEENEAF